jgi:hypothetical protein
METSVRYLEFAVKCDRLAKLAKSEEDRMILKEMTEAWKTIAREADRKEYFPDRPLRQRKSNTV